MSKDYRKRLIELQRKAMGGDLSFEEAKELLRLLSVDAEEMRKSGDIVGEVLDLGMFYALIGMLPSIAVGEMMKRRDERFKQLVKEVGWGH